MKSDISYLSTPLINSPNNDQDLAQRLQAGEEAAFTALYEQYHRAIYAYLLDFVKAPALAEDLVHEVFLKLWEIRERLTITTSLRAYIYRIAHNKAVDALKKIASDQLLREEVFRWLEPHLPELPAAGSRAAYYEQLYTEAVASLSPQRQKVFLLCREQGKTYEEAAAELGISRNTVKEHMVQSIRILRQHFLEKGALVFILLFTGKNF